jgi:hypothetical protein
VSNVELSRSESKRSKLGFFGVRSDHLRLFLTDRAAPPVFKQPLLGCISFLRGILFELNSIPSGLTDKFRCYQRLLKLCPVSKSTLIKLAESCVVRARQIGHSPSIEMRRLLSRTVSCEFEVLLRVLGRLALPSSLNRCPTTLERDLGRDALIRGSSRISLPKRDRAAGHRRESALWALLRIWNLFSSPFSGRDPYYAGFLLRFTVSSEKKLLLQTVWRRMRDSNRRYGFPKAFSRSPV